MTTTEQTTTKWLNLDELCPFALRAEVDDVVAALGRHLADIQPTLTRAGELLGRFEHEAHRAKRAIAEVSDPAEEPYGESAAECVSYLVDAVTGARRLHYALSSLSEAAEPEANLLYAAVANPGQLPVGVQVLIGTAQGVRRVTPMGDERGDDGERRFHTFDYETKDHGPVISHDELIDGIKRAQAAGLAEDQDLREANEVEG